jgi:hypothetical protein
MGWCQRSRSSARLLTNARLPCAAFDDLIDEISVIGVVQTAYASAALVLVLVLVLVLSLLIEGTSPVELLLRLFDDFVFFTTLKTSE